MMDVINIATVLKFEHPSIRCYPAPWKGDIMLPRILRAMVTAASCTSHNNKQIHRKPYLQFGTPYIWIPGDSRGRALCSFP